MLRVLRVEVLEQVPQELRCTPGHDQRDADSCGGVLGFGEKFAVDHDCGSFFSHFSAPFFEVLVLCCDFAHSGHLYPYRMEAHLSPMNL